MRKAMRVAAAGATLALTTLGLVACSSTSSGSSGGSSSNTKIASSEYGPITVVQGKDNNGTLPLLKAMWDKAHPKTPVTFKQQSDQADQQLQDLLLHFQQKSTDYDVVSSDVVWTQQLASNQSLTENVSVEDHPNVQRAAARFGAHELDAVVVAQHAHVVADDAERSAELHREIARARHPLAETLEDARAQRMSQRFRDPRLRRFPCGPMAVTR